MYNCFETRLLNDKRNKPRAKIKAVNIRGLLTHTDVLVRHAEVNSTRQEAEGCVLVTLHGRRLCFEWLFVNRKRKMKRTEKTLKINVHYAGRCIYKRTCASANVPCAALILGILICVDRDGGGEVCMDRWFFFFPLCILGG